MMLENIEISISNIKKDGLLCYKNHGVLPQEFMKQGLADYLWITRDQEDPLYSKEHLEELDQMGY